MNNPINLAIGVAVLCCSSCCSSSLANIGLGLGGLFGAPGDLLDLLTGGLGLDKNAPGFKGGFSRGVTDPVGGVGALADMAEGKPTEGNTITQVSKSDECTFKCGDCSQQIWDYFEEHQGKEQTDGRKAWCLGEGSCCSY